MQIKVTDEELREAVNQGLSQTEIANKYMVANSAVSRRCAKLDIKPVKKRATGYNSMNRGTVIKRKTENRPIALDHIKRQKAESIEMFAHIEV